MLSVTGTRIYIKKNWGLCLVITEYRCNQCTGDKVPSQFKCSSYLACTTNNNCKACRFIRCLRGSCKCKRVTPWFPNPWLWKQKYYFLVKTQLLRELFGESRNQNICFPLAMLDAEMPNSEPTLPACLCHRLIHTFQISHRINNRKSDIWAPNGGIILQVVISHIKAIKTMGCSGKIHSPWGRTGNPDRSIPPRNTQAEAS